VDQRVRTLERRLDSNPDDESIVKQLADQYRRLGHPVKAYKLSWKFGLIQRDAPETTALVNELAADQCSWFESLGPSAKSGHDPFTWPKTWTSKPFQSARPKPAFSIQFPPEKPFNAPAIAPPIPIHSVDLRGSYPQETFLGSFSKLKHWTSIERLDLARRALSAIHLMSLADLENLRDLNLHHNIRMTDDQSHLLPHWPKLERLNLSATSITGSGFDYLERYTTLKDLELSNLTLAQGALKALTTQNIESLGLRYSRFPSAGLKSIGQLKGLKELFLTGYSSRIQLQPLLALSKLESLSLGAIKITDKDLITLSQLKSLKHLDLWSTPITDRKLQLLSRLPNLQSLNIGETRVSEQGLTRISELPLTSLGLRGIALTKAGVDILTTMKTLKSVAVWGCNLSQDHREVLKQALPHCQFII
jgi:hypothetical protein